MSLRVVESVLAIAAARRGWRVAPLLLMASSALAFAFEPAALGHGLLLVGLGVACWLEPAEWPTSSRAPGGASLRPQGSLYQI